MDMNKNCKRNKTNVRGGLLFSANPPYLSWACMWCVGLRPHILLLLSFFSKYHPPVVEALRLPAFCTSLCHIILSCMHLSPVFMPACNLAVCPAKPSSFLLVLLLPLLHTQPSLQPPFPSSLKFATDSRQGCGTKAVPMSL